METPTILKCPECGSSRVFHDGFRNAPLTALSNEPIQRFRCADYGHRWSEHTSLNVQDNNKPSSQISAKAKNLASTQKIKICVERERHPPTENEIRATPKIENLLVQLKNDGKAKSTIRNYQIYLGLLLKKGANLFDPENTKAVLADMTVQQVSKRLCASMLNTWFDFNNIYWRKPTYYRDSKIPYIPTEEEIDQLIAGIGKKPLHSAKYSRIQAQDVEKSHS